MNTAVESIVYYILCVVTSLAIQRFGLDWSIKDAITVAAVCMAASYLRRAVNALIIFVCYFIVALFSEDKAKDVLERLRNK